MAGLVGGDSDSSALTQESGDEGISGTPRDSVVTGTDAGTDYAEEDIEMRDPSPGMFLPITVYYLLTLVQHHLRRQNHQGIDQKRRRRRGRREQQQLRIRLVRRKDGSDDGL